MTKERCYELNAWRAIVDARIKAVDAFEIHNPGYPLAFEELHDEMDDLLDWLEDYEDTCWDKYQVRPF